MCTRCMLCALVLGILAGCRGDEPETAVPVSNPRTTSPTTTETGESDSDEEVADAAEAAEETVSPPAVETQLVAGGVEAFAQSIEFLFDGPNAVQTDVANGAIQSQRAAVLRGRVHSSEGQPLSNVEVYALKHPECGRTRTGDDGEFSLVVNGGGQIALCYEHDEFLAIQRTVEVPWQEFVWLPDVVLLPLDDQVTAIDLTSEETQVARGTVVEDDDGTRQGTLVLPTGTSAEMILPDGTTRPLEQLSLRITEYTVGENGPASMPATLPPTSGYTYCFELSVEEATAAGSDHVVFNEPVYHYVENFLGFPVGTPVPVGYYDRAQAMWEPSDNGIIVEVLAVNDGLAELDVSGTGEVASAERMHELQITDDERRQLATLYQPGQTLWRIPVPHCTDPIDLNWPFGLPGDAEPPENDPPQPPNWDPCWSLFFSSIDIQNQSLVETIDLPGTSTQLSYHSARVRGRTAAYTLDIPLSGDNIPESLKRIDLEVSISGQQFRESFPPEPNLIHSITWDGRDAYGRLLQGSRMAHVRIGYAYEAVYMQPAEFSQSFARISNTPIESSRARQEYVLWHDQTHPVGTWDALGQQLGGWTLTDYHTYDPVSHVLYLGNGQLDSISAVDRTIDTIAGSGEGGLEDLGGFEGDGGSALNAKLNDPAGVAIAPDGTIYIADRDNHRIRRIDVNGVIVTVAGSGGIDDEGGGFAGDGGPATEALLSYPSAVALAPDGSLYIWDDGNFRIRRVSPNGVITTIAGGGVEYPGDGGPATAAKLGQPGQGSPRDRYVITNAGLAVDTDGTVYFTDFYGNLRYVDRQGVINTLVSELNFPRGMVMGGDGSLYVTEYYGHRIRRIGPDGSNSVVAGTGEEGSALDGVLATESPLAFPGALAIDREGTLYLSEINELAARNDTLGIHAVRTDGVLQRVGGSETAGFSGDGGSVLEAQLLGTGGMAFGPDGSLYLCDTGNHRLRRIGATFSGASNAEIAVPSAQGGELYIFDSQGRHLRTIDAISGETIRSFEYNEDGLLIALDDEFGSTTQINRSSDGVPTAIVGRSGLSIELNVDDHGYLSRVAMPDGRSMALTHTEAGLLTQYTDARGFLHRYGYDELGRLVSDEDPAGGSIQLARTSDGGSYTVSTTSALGREQSYQVEQSPGGGHLSTNRDAAGAVTTSRQERNGSRIVTLPDGTEIAWTMGADSRWGLQSPNVTAWSMTTPGGRKFEVANQIDAELQDPSDPMSLQSLTSTRTINGRVYTGILDVLDRSLVITTPAGRQSTLKYDDFGRILESKSLSLESIQFTYDDLGRVATTRQGDRVVEYEYDEQGSLLTIRDAGGQQADFVYDEQGGLSDISNPSGSRYQLAHYPSVNANMLLAPSGGLHWVTFTPLGQLASYTAPDGSTWLTEYDADRRATSVRLPGGRTLQNTYDAAGRWVSQRYPEATVTLSYPEQGVACCGADPPADLVRTPVEGLTQEMRFERDGQLLLGIESRGASNGKFDYRYDEYLQVAGVTLDDGPEMTLTRDDDGLVTGFGSFEVERNVSTGFAQRVSDGTADVSIEYDSLGRLATRTHSVGGVEVYRLELSYDASGRIAEQVETLSGESQTDRFVYDLDGRLTQVLRDDVDVEGYEYDANGNRISIQIGGAKESAVFDEQDRIVSRGDVDYGFDIDGFLAARGQDRFVYSARGELLTSQLANGTQVSYGYDPIGRCVSRTDDAGTLQFLYGNPGQPFQVTASRDAAGILTTYHYETSGTLFALEQGDEWFYVASDQVGTPRVIVNSAGEVVRTMEYDAYGAVTSYTGDEFSLPIGFAGGILDPATGLVRFGFRDYDPNAGSWTARDPLLFESWQPNLYAYVGGDPVNHVDPYGLVNWSLTEWSFGYGQNFWDFGISPNVWECISNLAAGFGDGISQAILGIGGLALGLGWNPYNLPGALRGDDSGQVNRSSWSYNLAWGLGAAWGAATVGVVAMEGGAGTSAGSGRTVRPPQFGPDDLVYGPSAGGGLRRFQQQSGGRLLTDIATPKPASTSWADFSKQILDQHVRNGGTVRVDLTHVDDLGGVLNRTGQYRNTVTAEELRHLRDNWDRFRDFVKFYQDNIEVPAPW